MKNTSSNIEMDHILNQLKNIRKVDAPDYLYTQVIARIKATKKRRIPLAWTSVAAILFIGLLITEIKIIKNWSHNNRTEVLEELVPSANNFLYK
jgi:hypothetical protein